MCVPTTRRPTFFSLRVSLAGKALHIRVGLLALAALMLLPSVPVFGQCDPGVDVEVFDAAPVVEGDAGRRDAVFRVEMRRRGSGSVSPSPPLCTVVLTFGTPAGQGSATAGADYVARGGLVDLSDSRREALVRVPVLGDTDDEADEDFFLVLALEDAPPEAVLVRPSARALIVDDDETAPAEIEVVGQADRSTVLGETVELAVRVVRPGAGPVSGALVEWRLAAGEGTFGDGAAVTASSHTGGDGVARQTLRPAGRPGVVRVVASLPEEGGAAEITVTTEGDLGRLPEPASGPASVGEALDQVCRDATGEMGALCDYLFARTDADQRAIVIAATPRQAAAVGNLAIHAGQTQVDTLADRLRSRRREAAGTAGDGGREAGGESGGSRAARGDRFDLRLAGPGWPTAPPLAALGRTGAGISAARHLDEESAVADAIAGVVARSVAAAQGDSVQGDPVQVDPVQVDRPLSGEPDYAVDPPSRLGFFASGRYSSGDRYSTYDEAGFDADVVGATVGLDYLVGSRAVVGAAAGWLDTGADFFARAGDLEGESWSLTAYGTVFTDTTYLELVVSGGRNDFTQRRGIQLPVPFAGADRYVATADLEGDQWGATLTAGADRAFGALTLEGFLRGSWVEAGFDAYRESGAGPFDLAVREQTVESLQGEAGVRLTYAVSYGWGVLQPHLRASWLHEFEDDVRLIRGRFVEDVQALDLVIPTEAPDADFANAGAGLTATFAGGRSLYVFYDRDLSRDGLEMGNLSFGLRFEL